MQPEPVDLPRTFANREALVAHVRATFPFAAERDPHVAPLPGGRAAALAKLATLDAAAYGQTRNYLDGAVSGLSPYIRHGVLTLAEVRDHALCTPRRDKVEKFINELCWREYWQRVYRVIGEGVWQDLEPYKTGLRASDYAVELPADILLAQTESACINEMIRRLYETGHLHNRLRMYLAAYVVHWRRVRWQAGAAWFLEHLLDGDPASNNLSWQWVASTFGSKPYIFNAENMGKYLGDFGACRGTDAPFLGTYEALAERLFPNGQGSVERIEHDFSERLARAHWRRATPLEKPLQRPIVWVHTESLSAASAALTAYPDAPALLVWDEASPALHGLGLKRMVFLYESAIETRAHHRSGNTEEALLAFAKEHDADGIVTCESPSPHFARLVRTLSLHMPVAVLSEARLVDDDGPFDLRRFSRFWERAREKALHR